MRTYTTLTGRIERTIGVPKRNGQPGLTLTSSTELSQVAALRLARGLIEAVESGCLPVSLIIDPRRSQNGDTYIMVQGHPE